MHDDPVLAMNETQIILTEHEGELLRSLARQTGKPERELVGEALELLVNQVSSDREKRLAILRQARGMWKDRDDLPTLSELREEMNRDFSVVEK